MRRARSTGFYRSVKQDDPALRMRRREVAAARPRFGYRRLYILLRREGWCHGLRPRHRRRSVLRSLEHARGRQRGAVATLLDAGDLRPAGAAAARRQARGGCGPFAAPPFRAVGEAATGPLVSNRSTAARLLLLAELALVAFVAVFLLPQALSFQARARAADQRRELAASNESVPAS